MRIQRIFRFVTLLTLFCILGGCGENSNTNGTLALSASAPPSGAGTADLTASAIVSPARTGTEVSLSVTQFGFNKTTGQFETVEVFTDKKSTDPSGLATFSSHSFVQSQIMATSLQVTATCQGLSQTTNIPIPIYVP